MIAEGRDGAVATIRLDRAQKKNALSIELRDHVSDAFDRLAADEDTKVVILTGTGDVFSAGFDLKEFENRDDADHMARLWASSDRFHTAVLECPLPTIAAINGPALAGGFDPAVMCDIRIAVPSVRFAHPEVLFGNVAYGPLRELIDGAAARELVLTGRDVLADEALALGLNSQIADASELMTVANALAQTIARPSRELVMRGKAKILRYAGFAGAKTHDL
jgi:enoyl-CoA hydratase